MFFPVRKAVIKKSPSGYSVIDGILSDDPEAGYDPFRLYSRWGDHNRAPHQEFIRVGTKEEVRDFIAKHGPLEAIGRRVSVPVHQFFVLQEEFLVAARLLKDPADIGPFIDRCLSDESAAYRHSDEVAARHYRMLPREIRQVMDKSGTAPSNKELRTQSVDEIRVQVQKKLPRLPRERRRSVGLEEVVRIFGERLNSVRLGLSFEGSLNRAVPRVYWHCGTLIETFYLMLLMDVDRGKVFKECVSCRKLFVPTKRPDQRTCGGICARRAASLLYHHSTGKYARRERRRAKRKAKPKKETVRRRGG